jgi:chemotaxis methyl-accepting protein methylase
MKDAEGVQFLQWCLPQLRLIWPAYRKVRRQVYKCLRRRLESLGLGSLAGYRTYLEAHPEEWEILDTSCWISISRFYRSKSVFQLLGQEVSPALAGLCRYLVFTYFDRPLQGNTLHNLVERMHVGGAFVIGKNERLPEGELGLLPWSEKEGVYRWAPTANVVT